MIPLKGENKKGTAEVPFLFNACHGDRDLFRVCVCCSFYDAVLVVGSLCKQHVVCLPSLEHSLRNHIVTCNYDVEDKDVVHL